MKSYTTVLNCFNDAGQISTPPITANWSRGWFGLILFCCTLMVSTMAQAATDCTTQVQLPATECQALVDFYTATGGTNWTDSPGNNWNVTTTPCSWTGVTCNGGFVSQIERYQSNLTGTLPTNLSNLTHLTTLRADYNHLTGTIPTLPTGLTTLWLSSNQLSGNLPTWPTSLTYLNLWGNQLIGTIPTLPTGLTYLHLAYNQLRGSIPTLPTGLTYLDLGFNSFSGNIPTLPAGLTHLDLNSNQLNGTIPTLSASLTFLELGNNQFSGTLPPLPTGLTTLKLANNALTGTLPAFANLTGLTSPNLDLSYNAFTGASTGEEALVQSKQPTWKDTLTVPPTNLQVTVSSPTQVQVSWTPITYTADGGYYQVKYSTTPGGPYTNAASTTANKSTTNYTVTGLSSNTSYYFVVETFTPAHAGQLNSLTSALSQEVSATANQTITFGALPAKTYGEVPFTLTATASSGLVVTYTATGGCSVSGNTVTLIQAGTCAITAHQAGNSNYLPAPDVTQTLTINLANQTITFGTLPNKTVGDAPFAFIATASSGLVVTYTATGNCAVSRNTVTLTGVGTCNLSAHQAGDSKYLPAADVTQTFAITATCQPHLTVTTTNDSGPGSLRDAITGICADGMITIDNSLVKTPILLTSGELVINKKLSIETAPTTDNVTIRRNSSTPFRLFNIASGLTYVVFRQLTIENGLATEGGGIYNNGSTLIIADSKICNNQVTGENSRGGGIYNNGVMLLSNTQICHNQTTDGYGGGIYNTAATALTLPNLTIVNGSKIYGNSAHGGSIPTTTAQTAGGGIFNAANGDMQIMDTLIGDDGMGTYAANKADTFGGGLANQGIVSLSNSQILANTASTGGGLYNTGVLTVFNTQVTYNNADSGGGLVNYKTAQVDSSKVSSNTAKQGGGIFNTGGILTLTGSTLSDNQAQITGGGIQNSDGGKLIIDNTILSGNRISVSDPVNAKGGGISNVGNNSSVTITNSQLLNNSASGRGGAFYNEVGTAPSITGSCLLGNSLQGIANISNIPVNATNNWWGTATGPSGAAPGKGDVISASVNYAPVQTTPILGCATQTTAPNMVIKEGTLNIANGSTMPIDFGSLTIDNLTIKKILTVSNLGTADLQITGIQLPVEVSAINTSGGPTNTSPITIAPGKSGDLTLEGKVLKAGNFTGIVTLTSNDPLNNPFTFTIKVTVVGPPKAGYASPPTPNTVLKFSDTPLGLPVNFELTLAEAGNLPLVVNFGSIKGDQANEFKILSPIFPVTINDGSAPQKVTIQCLPAQAGLRTAVLTLTSNDPDNPTLAYPLACTGTGTAIPKPHYSSTPKPGVLKFGESLVNTPVTLDLSIAEAGDGDLFVDFDGINDIIGGNATDFSILSPIFPLMIADGTPPQTVKLQCLPTQAGLRTATLGLTSNDPDHLLVLYQLECLGKVANQAGFSSTPASNSMVDFGSLPLSTAGTQTISIAEMGEADLTVELVAINSPDAAAFAEDFKVLSPTFPFTIPNGGAAVTVTVQCTPHKQGAQVAKLELKSNDPYTPSPSYALKCMGEGEEHPTYDSVPPPNAVLQVGSSVVGKLTSTRLTVTTKGTGTLEVLSSTFSGSHARDFNLTAGTTPFSLPAGEKSQVLTVQCLPSEIGERTATLTLTTNDVVQPTVSYNLVCRGLAESEQTMMDLTLSNSKVLENTPGGTTIGFLTTSAQQPVTVGEVPVYTYTLLENGNNTFEVIGNELRLASNAKLNFQSTPNYQIVVQSTDAAGVSLLKTFAVEVISTQTDKLGVTDIELSNDTVDANSAGDTLIGYFNTTGQQLGNLYTYSLLSNDNDNSPFVLFNDNELHLASGAKLDKTVPSYVISVRSTDTNGLSIEKQFTIKVINAASDNSDPPPAVLKEIFTGTIQTDSGVVGDQVSISAPEHFKVLGNIKPLPEDIGKLADIIMTYTWTQLSGSQAFTAPMTVAKQQPLATNMEFTLFEGTLAGLTGTFDVSLGYQLASETITSGSQPTQPTTGSQPAQPTTGSQPAQPTTGSQPGQPTTSGKPTTGSQPAQPTTGSQPGQPTTGGKPTTGSQPAQPATGSQPTQPATGSQPAQPATGSQPAQPTTVRNGLRQSSPPPVGSGATPSGTPTGSPTGTPTGSPTGTPTGTPTASPAGTSTGSPSGSQPTTGGQPTQPMTSGQPIQPTTGGQPTQPTTGGQPTQPTTGGQPTQPTTGGQPTQPTTGGQPTQPTTGGQPTPPTTSGQPTQPTTGGKPTPPTTGGQPTQPTTGGQPTQPTTGGQPTPPTTGGQPTPPMTGGQPTPPTTSGQPAQPTTGGKPTQPTTSGQPAQPTTSGKTEQPTTGGQSGQPTTSGKTEQPAKTPTTGNSTNKGDNNPGKFLSAHIVTLEVQANRPPTDIRLSANTVAENGPADTLIGRFTTTDPDTHDQFIYGLTSNEGRYFKVVGDELRTTGFSFDFSSRAEYPITVRSVDAAGAFVDKNFTIQVKQAQTSPKEVYLTKHTILENSPNGTVVGKFYTDNRKTSTYRYELTDDAGGRFQLKDDLLVVADGTRLDFEQQTSHTIAVRGQDTKTQQTITKTFSIEVLNQLDVSFENVVISTPTGASLPAGEVKASEEVAIKMQMIPDKEQVGQTVDLIAVATVVQDGQTTQMMHDGQQWQEWDGDVATLRGFQSLTLQSRQELTLWQGKFSDFAGSQWEIYVGYLLQTGEIVYSPAFIEIKVQ